MERQSEKTGGKPKILIVDDNYLNQQMLQDIVSSQYEVEFADDGKIAIEKINSVPSDYYSMMMLDLNMPVLDGFGVLGAMRSSDLMDHFPIVVISSETDDDQIEKAYTLGAMDFINRPFNENIVLKRISNLLALFAKKKKLEDLVVRQFYDKEKNSQFMIDVLANVVEFRNGESADHIIHIRAFTTIMLHALREIAPQYNLDSDTISYIVNASSLHDIGKISIPSGILNKPGKFTEDEFEIMKSHSAKGAEILEKSEGYETSKLLKIARDICRWHHERWNGTGYPDGLKGDEIPIAAQIVALADCYDALISPRVYKSAYPHDKAIKMILNGECGQFNPVVMEVLKKVEPDLRNGFDKKLLDSLEIKGISESAMEVLSRI